MALSSRTIGWRQTLTTPLADTVPPSPPPLVSESFRPSGHTGLLLSALRRFSGNALKRSGLDMGIGSGTVLAMLGTIGVERLFGVDIDPEALAATARLMAQTGLQDRADLRLGSLWEPLQHERFDIIASNMPQFAATEPADPEHSPHWSFGGPDGRRFMDPFLADLRDHMDESSVAYITHNRFLGMERTEALLRQTGLAAREILSSAILLHPLKAALLHADIRSTPDRSGLILLGPYEFMEVQILEIRPRGAA